MPGLGLFVTAMAVIAIANAMPRKSDAGSEVAARWKAFSEYLRNIDKYTDVAAQKEIWDRWLPYAIAFGIDKDYIRKFESVDAPAPGWYIPSPTLYGPYHRRYYGPGSGPVVVGGWPWATWRRRILRGGRRRPGRWAERCQPRPGREPVQHERGLGRAAHQCQLHLCQPAVQLGQRRRWWLEWWRRLEWWRLVRRRRRRRRWRRFRLIPIGRHLAQRCDCGDCDAMTDRSSA